ncbi:MAG: cbb3-type cytochrome c oxidase N-terminal domain-containing protein [Candidatus Zixiibacteriota bacterium]
MAEHKDELLDHNYDGIHELDNDLPPWWLYMFYITIVWGVLYFAWYHVFGFGYLSADEYQKEINPKYTKEMNPNYDPSSALTPYKSPMYKPGGDDTPYLLAHAGPKVAFVEERPEDEPEHLALTDPAEVASGAAIFKQRCVQCHGAFGEGGIGPNLTDQYWLHGAGMNNVVKTVKFGVPAKGMIAWRGFITQEEILKVASYVLTLQGTNPPNPKAPQGNKVE